MGSGTWEDRVDRAIDEVIAGRDDDGRGWAGGQRRVPLDRERSGPLQPAPDPVASLVGQLGGLRPVDWPDEGVPERIAARLAPVLGAGVPGAELTGAELSGDAGDRRHRGARARTGSAPAAADGERRHGHRHRLPGSRRKAVVVGGAAAVVIAAALVALVGYGSFGGRASRGTTALSVVASPGWRLVDSVSSPFAAVGPGPQAGDLECVTATVCYASNDAVRPDGQAPAERTVDGGATWQPMAALPDGMGLQWPLSCPTAQTCMAAASVPQAGAGGTCWTGPTPHSSICDMSSSQALPSGSPLPASALPLVVTTDGGSHWQVVSVPSPAGMSGPAIDQVACATAEQCVVHVDGTALAPASGGPSPVQRTGAFFTTDDGGATWTAASSAPPAASRPLWALQCAAGGTCLGIAMQPTPTTGTTSELVALQSGDGGTTWTAEPPVQTNGRGTMEISCGDTVHCMAVSPSETGTGVVVATTADGGATWQTAAAPSTWPTTGIAVSCATGEDCWVSLADSIQSQSPQGYDDPAIEATHDGGATWSSLPLPSVGGSALALVFPLSCPTSAGCIGVGATPREFDAPPAVSSTGDGAPVACTVQAGCIYSSTTTSGAPVPGRVIVSNLPQQ